MTEIPENTIIQVKNNTDPIIKVIIERDGLTVQGHFISLKEIKSEISAINQDLSDMKAHLYTGDKLDVVRDCSDKEHSACGLDPDTCGGTSCPYTKQEDLKK